jgi:hypothetical protein
MLICTLFTVCLAANEMGPGEEETENTGKEEKPTEKASRLGWEPESSRRHSSHISVRVEADKGGSLDLVVGRCSKAH